MRRGRRVRRVTVMNEVEPYSGTWSWVKLLSVPESPPLGLYDTMSTVPVQAHKLLHAIMRTIGNVKMTGGSTSKYLK